MVRRRPSRMGSRSTDAAGKAWLRGIAKGWGCCRLCSRATRLDPLANVLQHYEWSLRGRPYSLAGQRSSGSLARCHGRYSAK